MAVAWGCCLVDPFPSLLTPLLPTALRVVVSHQVLKRASALASLMESLSNTRTALLLLNNRPPLLLYSLWSIVHLDSALTIRPKDAIC